MQAETASESGLGEEEKTQWEVTKQVLELQEQDAATHPDIQFPSPSSTTITLTAKANICSHV